MAGSTHVVDVASAPRTPVDVEWRLYIGGEWVSSANVFDDVDPYRDEVMARVPRGTRDDVRQAIVAARDALPAWQAMAPAARQECFLAAADIVRRRQHELVRLLALETGATLPIGMFQIELAVSLLRQAAALAYAPQGTIIPSDLPGTVAMAMRRPAGVVAGLAPWNGPLFLSLRSIASAMALGNTAVLKPSELAPLTGGLILAEVFDESGFPPGVVNVITHAPGDAGPIGDELFEHPAVRRISFTGSTATGRRLAEQAGRHLKRMVLELGGHNPVLVLDDADIEYAVDAACFGAFVHQGQVCMSTRRLLVDRSIADEFVDLFVAKAATLKTGDPLAPDTVIGPLIGRDAARRARDRIDEAVDAGGRLLAGGELSGNLLQPTVMIDVPPTAALRREETFAPIVAIDVVDGVDESIARANDTGYGLVAGLITRNHGRAFDLAQRLDSGIVHINDQTVNDEPQMPFGGVKDSGWGRFGGTSAIEEFTETHWVTIRPDGRTFPF